MVLLWILLTISSGSVFCTAYFKRRWEELVPATIFFIIVFLYTFAIFDFLKLGAILLTVLIVGIYAVSALKVIREHSYRLLLSYTFTPAFFIFVLLFFACLWATEGMAVHLWDEFSHWADTVKAIYSSDLLGTKISNLSSFMSYPPAMSLFQYFFLQFKGEYCEWLLYFVQKIFAISLFMPFLSKIKKYNFGSIFLIAVACFCSLTIFYSDFYFSLYIDGILGLTFGFLIAYIFLIGIEEWVSFATVCLGITTITLLKAAGEFFGICIAGICLAVILHSFLSVSYAEKTKRKYLIIRCCILFACLLYPIISWKLKLEIDESIINFSGKFDLVNFAAVISGKDSGYRQTVLMKFLHAFFSPGLAFGQFFISNFFMSVIFCILLILVCKLHKKTRTFQKSVVAAVLPAIIFVYTLGLLFSYMYKFSEFEALRLASFRRYMNIVWTGVFFFFLTCTIDFMCKDRGRRFIYQIALLISILFSSQEALGSFVSRNEIILSQQNRSQFTGIVDKLQRNQDDSKVERIFLISQGSDGFDYCQLKYLFRPDYLDNGFKWSLGSELYWDDDIYTKDIPLDEWKQELYENYDFVVIYHADKQFISAYGAAFEDPSSICDQTVYKVDKEKQTLIHLA